MFRLWLADTEGFALAESAGSVETARGAVSPPSRHHCSTTHTMADSSRPLNAQPCCPDWRRSSTSSALRTAPPVLLRRVDGTRQLVPVMQYCLDKDRTQPSSPCPRRRKTASARTTGLPCPWHGASVSGTTAPSRRSWGAAGMGRRQPTGTKSVHARTLAWSRPRGVRFPSHPWPPHGRG